MRNKLTIRVAEFDTAWSALQNAIKHSGAKKFEVSLKRTSNEVQLSVHDSGVGFDAEQTIKGGHGLGLTCVFSASLRDPSTRKYKKER